MSKISQVTQFNPFPAPLVKKARINNRTNIKAIVPKRIKPQIINP